MANLVIKQSVGFSKEGAATSVGFNSPLRADATIAYNNAKDNVGFSLSEFAKAYVDTKLRGAENIGVYIRLENAVKDTRTQPYQVVNFPTVGKTQYEKFYVLMDGNTEIGKHKFKSGAESLAKQIVTQNRDEISKIKIVKRKDPIGEDATMIVSYVPSKGTKEGSFIFFALEA